MTKERVTHLRKILKILLAIVLIVPVFGNFVFEYHYQNLIYPGVKINNQDFGYYSSRKLILPVTMNWTYKDATFSAKTIDLGIKYDTNLMRTRAYSIGRQTGNFYYDFLQKLAAVSGNINLPEEIAVDESAVDRLLAEIAPQVESPAIDGKFTFEPDRGPDGRGRVIEFAASKNGLVIDRDKFRVQIKNFQEANVLPVKIVYPKLTTSAVNLLGIKELLGKGESYFYDSIPGRMANIKIGADKISGSLIPPGGTFSFNQSIGTISAIFGFQKAYVIKENKTALEDGGGVCQVSTTLYRAVLNSGLSVLEREGHTYRVPFYEEGGFKPGLDATVYPPSPDFKFKNDTTSWLLVQATYDAANSKLTFDIFGASDGRQTKIDGPYITSASPPPEPIYEDDPTSPLGQVKQTDTAHWGANTYFKRIVTRNGQDLINETISTNYIPWPARFLRGTKP